MDVELGSLTLKEEHRLKVFENWVLMKTLGLRQKKWWETGEDCIMRSVITCIHHQILLG
jgi:hypothetical protein